MDNQGLLDYRQAVHESKSHESRPFGLTDDERFYFDLAGYTVVRGALTGVEVAHLNDVIERNRDQVVREEVNQSLPASLQSHAPRLGRQLLEGFLWLPSPDGDGFRDLLVHPAVVERLNEICGPRFRLDSSPFMIEAEEGVDGDYFHGHGEPFAPSTGYYHRNGRMYANGVVALWALSDADPGFGGFGLAVGSHKSKFSPPPSLKKASCGAHVIVQPELKAGDLLIFIGSTTHGTLAWRSARPRRALLYKYSSRTTTRAAGEPFLPERVHGRDAARLSSIERAVMYGPGDYYGEATQPRLTAPELVSDGTSVRIVE